jgi:hypothetical protein
MERGRERESEREIEREIERGRYRHSVREPSGLPEQDDSSVTTLREGESKKRARERVNVRACSPDRD